jgi:hypothetical protein
MAHRSLFALITASCMLAACDARMVADLGNTPAYKGVVGSRYEVVGALDAYGVKLDLQAGPDYVALIPPPGVSGPEIAFTVPVARGSTVTVLQVFKTNRWQFQDVTLIVALEGTRLPIRSDIHLDLFRGNEGPGKTLLNPAIYRKLPAP